MDAKKCDRCGSYFDNTNMMNTDIFLANGIVSSVNMQNLILYKDRNKRVDIELCPGCAQLLTTFLSHKDAEIAFPDHTDDINEAYKKKYEEGGENDEA